jgi:hypothetical protein
LLAAVFLDLSIRIIMEILFYIVLAIAIEVVIVAVVLTLGKKRVKMSFNEYLQKYGSIGPYSSSDVNKYM